MVLGERVSLCLSEHGWVAGDSAVGEPSHIDLDDALLHPDRPFTRDASAYPSDGITLLGGSIRTLLGWVHASDCEKRGIIVDLLSSFTHGVQAIPRFGNALGVGQASLASASSPSRTSQELREAADPDGGREAVLKWSCCQAYFMSSAVVQETVVAVCLGAVGKVRAAALSPSTFLPWLHLGAA